MPTSVDVRRAWGTTLLGNGDPQPEVYDVYCATGFHPGSGLANLRSGHGDDENDGSIESPVLSEIGVYRQGYEAAMDGALVVVHLASGGTNGQPVWDGDGAIEHWAFTNPTILVNGSESWRQSFVYEASQIPLTDPFELAEATRDGVGIVSLRVNGQPGWNENQWRGLAGIAVYRPNEGHVIFPQHCLGNSSDTLKFHGGIPETLFEDGDLVSVVRPGFEMAFGTTGFNIRGMGGGYSDGYASQDFETHRRTFRNIAMEWVRGDLPPGISMDTCLIYGDVELRGGSLTADNLWYWGADQYDLCLMTGTRPPRAGESIANDPIAQPFGEGNPIHWNQGVDLSVIGGNLIIGSKFANGHFRIRRGLTVHDGRSDGYGIEVRGPGSFLYMEDAAEVFGNGAPSGNDRMALRTRWGAQARLKCDRFYLGGYGTMGPPVTGGLVAVETGSPIRLPTLRSSLGLYRGHESSGDPSRIFE